MIYPSNLHHTRLVVKEIIKYSAVAISLMSVGTAASAHDDTYDETRLLRLEKIVSGLPRISGFVNFRYEYSDADGTSNSFDIRRARLDLHGDLDRKFDYRLQVEFAGSPKILDGYFRWKPSGYINAQLGQYKIPFTLENVYGPHQLETIENSMVITGLSGYTDISGISANGRDIGVSLYGGFFNGKGFNLVDYHVGIFNGNGINARDNNNDKDFSGRINVTPIKYLTVSASHYNGSTGPKGDTFRRVRTALGVKYDDKKLLLRTEYVFGKTADLKTDGVYAVAALFVHPKWQPLIKYDHYREDISVSEGNRTNYIAGVNYFPIRNVRLQLNYTRKTVKAAGDSNCVAFQIFGLF